MQIMRFLHNNRTHFAVLTMLALSACAGNPDAIPVGPNRNAD